jgi:hypothetical protein
MPSNHLRLLLDHIGKLGSYKVFERSIGDVSVLSQHQSLLSRLFRDIRHPRQVVPTFDRIKRLILLVAMDARYQPCFTSSVRASVIYREKNITFIFVIGSPKGSESGSKSNCIS